MVAESREKISDSQRYLEWEERQTSNMSTSTAEVFCYDGTIPHNAIAVNLTHHSKNHLRGGSCHCLHGRCQTWCIEVGPFHYPDVIVTCDRRDKQAIKFIQYPCLIAEFSLLVLKVTTER